jgi:hypothetical protein
LRDVPLTEGLGVTEDSLELVSAFGRAKCNGAVVPVNCEDYIGLKDRRSIRITAGYRESCAGISGSSDIVLQMPLHTCVLFFGFAGAQEQLGC